MNLTSNFEIEEFASPDVDYFPISVINNLAELAQNLEIIRSRLGEPIYISSGWRTVEHNRRVGGAKDSQHLLGKAADIWSEIYSPKEIHYMIEQLINAGVMQEGGVGLYNTFVHYDIRGAKARWDETS